MLFAAFAQPVNVHPELPPVQGLRKAYKLPPVPAGLGEDTDASAVNTDCIS